MPSGSKKSTIVLESISRGSRSSQASPPLQQKVAVVRLQKEEDGAEEFVISLQQNSWKQQDFEWIVEQSTVTVHWGWFSVGPRGKFDSMPAGEALGFCGRAVSSWSCAVFGVRLKRSHVSMVTLCDVTGWTQDKAEMTKMVFKYLLTATSD